MTPFAAVEHSTEESALQLGTLVASGEHVGILNVIPPLGDEWGLVKEIEIYQYIWDLQETVSSDREAILLTEDHVEAMLELTAMVYPAYFRPETAKLGDYFGIVRDGELCAMAGVRMAMDGHQELSAICTHPAHRGLGLASRLTRHLIGHVQSQGDVPFLHTESDNHVAQSVYEKLGFRVRKRLPFKVFERLG